MIAASCDFTIFLHCLRKGISYSSRQVTLLVEGNV